MASKQITSKGTAVMTYTRFTLDRSTPSLWRVTFNHPPINLIDSVMIGELGELLAEIEENKEPAVLVFDSADPDYFLAHYDIPFTPGSTSWSGSASCPRSRSQRSAGESAPPAASWFSPPTSAS